MSRVFRADFQLLQWLSLFSLPSQPDSYLDIVIQTTFRRLQVKLPEDKLHPVPHRDCDHSGFLKVTGVRLGI